MSHTQAKPVLRNPSKRIVKLHKHIARALEADGHDADQIQGACQAAVNDVEGKEGEAKIGSMKHTSKAKAYAKWRENIPVTYEVKAGNAYDFICWHDALVEGVFEKHGEPVGEITADLIPGHLVMWLAGIKKRREDKAKGKADQAPVAPKVGKGKGKGRISTPANGPATQPA